MTYYQSWFNFEKTVSKIQQQIIDDNKNDHSIVHNLLGYHYWLQHKVADVYNDGDISEPYKKSSFVHAMFTHNFLACYSILIELERNLIHSARASKRNVLESIVKMNYLAFFPKDVWFVLFGDHMSGVRGEQLQNIKFNELQHISYFQNAKLDVLLQKTYRKYHFKWFVNRIYDKPTADAMFGVHREMSHSAHPSLLRPQQDFNPQIISYEIYDLAILLFYNILAEVEGHKHMISENEFPSDVTRKFIDEMLELLNRNKTFPSLFPDHSSIASKVLIHPPGHPWND